MQKLFRMFIIVLIMTTLGCNISGTVKDKDGNPLVGATVTLNSGKTVTTNSDGVYGFSGLNAGNYSVSAVYEDIVFVYPTISVKILLTNVTANFVEYVPPEPATYDLSECDGGVFLDVKVYSPKAGAAIYLDAEITQTIIPDSDLSEFTCELLDFPGIIFEGYIDGEEYIANVVPANYVTLNFGSNSAQIQFRSLRLTATEACEFTGYAGVRAKSGIIIGTDTVQINSTYIE